MSESRSRRYDRVAITPAKHVAVEGSGRRAVYLCTRMGLGGMFLQSAEPLPEGATIRFGFTIDAEVIRGVANVRSTSSRGMGLAFRSFQRAEHRAKVNAFVKRHRPRV